MPDPIGWPQLVVLMAFGPDGRDDTDTVRGTVHTRTVDALADDDDRVATHEHPVLGRMVAEESTTHVARHGDRVRVSRPDGGLSRIDGADTSWSFGDDGVPEAHERPAGQFPWTLDGLVRRLPLSRWEGTDFTRLTGPIAATILLGRPAWTFELAPPRHKPYPLQLIVDARSGLVLRQANRDLGSVTEWTEFEYGVELADELFVWDGPVRATPTDEDRTREHETELATRRAWLAGRGIDEIPLPAQQRMVPHEWDDATGAFHASVEVTLHASLLRRRASPDRWRDADRLGWRHVHRWSDANWDWALGTDSLLTDDQLAALRERLATST